MNTAIALTTELVIDSGFATLAGARRAVNTANKSKYADANLQVRVRPNAEWAKIGIDKDEFVVVSITPEGIK